MVMKRVFGVFLAVLLSVMLLAVVLGVRRIWAEPQGWSKTYGGPNYDGAYALVQTSDDGYALAGYTSSFGAGSHDFWLVKTDASGAVPELSSPMVLAALFIVASSAVILAKRKHRTRLTPGS